MDTQTFANALIEAAKAIDAARTADDALDALAQLEALSHDHSSLRLLASSFLLLHAIFLDDHPPEKVSGQKLSRQGELP